MMKRVTAVFTGVVLAFGLTACGSQGSGNNTPEDRQEAENQPDAAQAGQETTEQALDSGEDLDWTDKNSRVVYEHDNPEARTIELAATTVDDWDSYDTVFIGYAGGIIGLN